MQTCKAWVLPAQLLLPMNNGWLPFDLGKMY